MIRVMSPARQYQRRPSNPAYLTPIPLINRCAPGYSIVLLGVLIELDDYGGRFDSLGRRSVQNLQ
jgi:hypothetical protein